MTDKQPTEAQWRLITVELGWTLVEQFHPVRIPVNTCKICSSKPSVLVVFPATGETIFDPLHDYNDLARLVQAMQAAGYMIIRHHFASGNCLSRVTRPDLERGDAETGWLGEGRSTGDLAATFWAIVEALEAKEKQDGR